MQSANFVEKMTVSEPIRVLHTLGWASQGGVEQLRVLLALNLPQGATLNELICQQASPSMVQRFEAEGWTVHEIGLARHIFDISWYLRALRIARSFRPHVIHGAVFEGNALAAICGLFLSRTSIILEEQSDGRGRTWRGRILLRMLAIRAQKFIGVAPDIANYLTQDVHIPARKVVTIPNASRQPSPDDLASGRLVRQMLSIPDDAMVIGSMGRLFDDHKRFSDLIRVFSQVLNNWPESYLLIVGEGPDRDLYESQIREYGLEGLVFLPGFTDDVFPWLNAMDIFVLPSAGEALPLALIEAMFAHLPCITTSVGGNSFVLDGGEVGVLIEPNDEKQLLSALQRLMGSTEDRKVLGQKAALRANLKFGSELYSHRVLALWKECVSLRAAN